jgi:hypothetical protein
MRILALALLLAGCSAIEARQEAITGCRDAGYISAVKDAGAWYCYQDRLDRLPQPLGLPRKPQMP